MKLTKLITGKMVLTLAILTGMVVQVASAAEAVPANRTIVKLQTYTNLAVIQFDPPYTNSIGCAYSLSNEYAALDWSTDSNRKALYATLLGAYLTNRTIGLGISGCNERWGGGIPNIYRVDIGTQ